MAYNPNIHNRKSIRLKGYDYSQSGLYFVTICCQDRICLFGRIENKKITLNDAGQMINDEWLKLPERFPNIKLHEFIVMPNHFHGILKIVGGETLVVSRNDAATQNDNAIQKGHPRGVDPTGKTLGDMVGAFQSITTVKYINGVKTKNWKRFNKKMWQRNYWEHIIRNKKSLIKIGEYIIDNPKKWDIDKFNKF